MTEIPRHFAANLLPTTAAAYQHRVITTTTTKPASCWYVNLTGFPGGTCHWLRRRSTSEIVNSHHVELVLRVGAQGPYSVEHRTNPADLAERL